jgi:hypothetical protein
VQTAKGMNDESVFRSLGHDDLAALECFEDLRRLCLARTRISDKGLAQIKKLARLSSLNLYDTNITDAGAASLKTLTQLKHLSLVGTAVTSEGVQQLRTALPNTRIDALLYFQEWR